ncbi:MAG: NADH-quinone oxidoreductase subunit NuoF [Waddliaceae bacterium]|jgi:NADH:ubiquinone oxidoreductase subunit F (NADH-binding)|nr:NADH-quinone oxidoreductase subunit NuoF [Waddliaceae bacterium]MBT3579432.1 NADH-quinone oxidoreductase subunit NuoF [Waddliaceae bacterium]MBT4445185.1 NADH-quinone oxidoreductase subunit NuoF [Waddliaceae bacterium]MBT6928150.1 NADH-quinone oxidoreductase subunit NuoF [Waddliaceae bacterium]MBT7264483.1 NADH-quinone oxidoreductase subunit NuoF [Waddliaceae bacterium]
MENILLKDIETPNLKALEVFRGAGGYKSLQKALSMDPEALIEEIKASKLVGRGGAGFPTGLKWEFTRKAPGDERYLVCNADEGEPGTFKDRVLLKNNPHLLIEGMAIAGYAIDAKKGYIYIRGEYFEEIKNVKAALEEARAEGLLGDNINGSGYGFDIEVYCGAGAYVCGEETSLFESLEGKRGNSREKPPFPTISGYDGKPTAINNVETLCNIPSIVENGGEWYANIGDADAPGPKLFCVSGSVNKPGVYEAPMGITLRDLIDSYAGGVKGTFKAALPGGISSALITDIDTKLDPKNVAAAGSMLGSAAVIVINDETNIIDVVENSVEFFAHESCGFCTPCREGTRQACHIIKKIKEGKGTPEDLSLLEEMADFMCDTSRCGLGQAALNVTTSAMKHFKEEFDQGVKQ